MKYKYRIIDGFGNTLHKSETLQGAKKWKDKFECKDPKIRNKLKEKMWKIKVNSQFYEKQLEVNK